MSLQAYTAFMQNAYQYAWGLQKDGEGSREDGEAPPLPKVPAIAYSVVKGTKKMKIHNILYRQHHALPVSQLLVI